MNAFNAVFRRAYSTKALIPPNVAAATKVSGSGAKDAQLAQLVTFYKVLHRQLESQCLPFTMASIEPSQGYC